MAAKLKRRQCKLNELIKELKRAINRDKGTSAYYTDAKVIRTEDNIAWVHIPGGVEETPVNMSITAKPGDQVRVRVSNTGAYLIGNMTSPPTDDRLAKNAEDKAIQAESAAGIAKQAAEIAAIESQEAQKKAKKVEDEQKKSVRNKIISEAGTYHGRIGIAKKQFTFLPVWYGIFTSTTGGGAFEACPHTIRLSYVSNGVKKSFVSEKKMWATPASTSLIGNEYDSKTAAEAAVRNFKANNSPPDQNWTIDDVALFVNKSGSRYIIEEYPRILNYPGRVGKDYEIYCIVNKTDQGNYRIEIASYYQNDKPGDKDNYVLSKSSTQKLIIEYDMETTKVAKAMEFGETTTATTKDVTVFGSYNDETSDDDATVFGNGTEESPQTAVSVKKNGDMVVKGATYAQDFKIGEEFLSFRDITYKVKKMDDEQSKPLLVTEAFDSDFMSFTAGTIGTRGAQKKISITKDGYNPILVTIFYIASSASCHPLAFFNEDRDAVYVNLYRATKSSYGSENPVRFLVTYMRKK